MPKTLRRIILPLVPFAAGSLLGGAFLHIIPAGLAQSGSTTSFFAWILAGFTTFFALKQLLHWHHSHRASTECKRPITYLILVGDGLPNFIGGCAIASAFLLRPVRVGKTSRPDHAGCILSKVSAQEIYSDQH